MRGTWSKSLLPVADQELAGPLNSVDADLPRLTASFTHDFEKDGLPDKYFRSLSPANGVRISPEQDGLRVAVQASGVWTSTEIVPRFGLSGDFEFEATFGSLQLESSKQEACHILLAPLSHARPSQ